MLHWGLEWKLASGDGGNVESLNSVNKHRIICNLDIHLTLFTPHFFCCVLIASVEGVEQQRLCGLAKC